MSDVACSAGVNSSRAWRALVGAAGGMALVVWGMAVGPYFARGAAPAATTKAAGLPTVTNTLGMKFVLIPAGEFLMGFAPGQESYVESEPQRKIKISKAFYFQTTEVTQKQFGALIKGNDSAFKGDSQPVERTSWDDAVEFCKLLGEKEGKTYRLPTEAEWEYACRAGTTTPYHFGETISTEQANYDGNFVFGKGVKGVNRGKTVNVMSFPPNAWGLYDMHGNVWEWCSDWDGGYQKGDAVDPTGPKEGVQRVMRGGAYNNEPAECRSASRDWYDQDGRRDSRGFRVVMVAEGK